MAFKIITFNIHYRSSQILGFLRAIAHHNDLIKQLRILFHSDIDDGKPLDRHRNILKANTSKDQRSICRDSDGIFSGSISGRSIIGTFLQNKNTGKRLTRAICNLTGHIIRLCHRKDAEHRTYNHEYISFHRKIDLKICHGTRVNDA